MKGSNYRLGDLIMGFYGGLWAYSGWDVLNYGSGEIKNPRKFVFFKVFLSLVAWGSRYRILLATGVF